jgi:hypothetical protein
MGDVNLELALQFGDRLGPPDVRCVDGLGTVNTFARSTAMRMLDFAC